MAVIFCFDSSSEDKETRLLDEKDINKFKSQWHKLPHNKTSV